MTEHPNVSRPDLSKTDGYTSTRVEVALNSGFGALRCCVQFLNECRRHSRCILMARIDEEGEPIELDSITAVTMLSSPRGEELRIFVEGTDQTAEHILLRLASALTGSDSFNLEFDYFEQPREDAE
jgi:phosphotransferase system HPr-like phosphotransfer protein